MVELRGVTWDHVRGYGGLRAAADAYREDVVSVPILQFSEGSVYANRMHGFTVSTWEYAPWDSENWWVEQGA